MSGIISAQKALAQCQASPRGGAPYRRVRNSSSPLFALDTVSVTKTGGVLCEAAQMDAWLRRGMGEEAKGGGEGERGGREVGRGGGDEGGGVGGGGGGGDNGGRGTGRGK